MALLPVVIFQFLLFGHVRAHQNQSHLISLGSSLFPNAHPTSWSSPSGHFAFGFYPQGNGFAVGIWMVSQPKNTVVWTANRDEPPVSSNATLELTRNGTLLIRTEEGKEKLIANVSDSEPADSASMLDSGNFVLYGNNSSIIWQSFLNPTDTLLGGQNLSSGHNLVSSMSSSDHSSGKFCVSMQHDGNFVAYPVNTSGPDNAYWASNTFSEGSSVQLNLTGFLYVSLGEYIKILASSSYPTKRVRTIYRATLDADGILRLYSHHFENNTFSNVSIEWSDLSDQCDVKGFCSFNSYCSSKTASAECYCYPGFVWVDQSKKSLGCSKNFTEDDCRKDLNIHYNMTVVDNLWLNVDAYYVEAMIKEDCSRSCQEDCNCGAAVYESKNCNKYKLPLRYGRTNGTKSGTAFFKLESLVNDHRPFPNPKIVTKDSKSLILILGIILGPIAFICFILAISSFCMYQHRIYSYRKLSENGNLGLREEFALRSFSYSELEEATDEFKEELGRGSFGAVYKGTLPSSSKTIAVKRLEEVVEERERKFQAEMTAIGQTHHRNLVRLLGFCSEGSRKLLVYEYMSNGSLADVLFKTERRPVWKERVRIALEVARGILYLHEGCEVHIIHCNIKPQNILIDDSWTAKISDFGLAKLLIANQTKSFKEVTETKWYLAPEWHSSAMISFKADIYSFGVVLLEIICCRSSKRLKEDEIILSAWVYNCFVAGVLEQLVEDEDVDLKTLERMVKVGLWCIQDAPALRPPMNNVLLMLEGTMDVAVPPPPALVPYLA